MLTGLAMLLSCFVMAPTLNTMNVSAIQPYSAGKIGATEMIAITGLLSACVLLAVFGESAFAYAAHTADWLGRPDAYVRAVLGGGA